ncbi:cupin domain-containing protein [Flavobacterium cellulosilyticum]|uniref:Cupin domain-containing protein n=1 Tax=Flavobacterium cellulosilyticum TaxID=2541731 RepID=A0A4R5C8K7_9FLAO|nr:cupin domain-containing protein [Flavobacterium cellulosilyticum]TDD95495.1 cupin domain-containing protein [Flavobacterium cellulosilyticum]
MERFSQKFIVTKEMEWEKLGGGVSRKILGYDNQIMMVLVKFEKGALGAPHQHFHTQATYCVSGKFEFEIDGIKQIVEAEDGVYIQPNLLHSAVCLEEGMLIDTFSPVREDFLRGGAVSYFGDKDDSYL